LIDEPGVRGENRALIDGTLVGDLTSIERRRDR
jgi:hypothetical protein